MGFAFQYDDAVKSMFKSGIPKYLDPNRRPLDGETYTCANFLAGQLRSGWRGKTKKASILVQPLSKMDETTNKGATIVIISHIWNVETKTYEMVLLVTSTSKIYRLENYT